MKKGTGTFFRCTAFCRVFFGLRKKVPVPFFTTVRRLHALKQVIPQPLHLRALLDTGADGSCVDPEFVRGLSLPLKNIVMVNIPAAGGLKLGIERAARLTILHPSGILDDSLQIVAQGLVEVELGSNSYQALIGRDVLARCDFHYQGRQGQFQVKY